MQYEPIKKSLGKFIAGSIFMRKALYQFLDILLLRSWHVRKKLREISDGLKDRRNVLDAGSGLGQYTWRMARLNSLWSIKAIDIDEDHISDCRNFFSKTKYSPRVEFQTCDLTTLCDHDKYDIILSVDVMEHISDDVKVFTNFYEALRNNGCLIISTPSDKGGSDVHEGNGKSFIDEHVRDGYSIDEITSKLKKSGFTEVTAGYTYGIPGNISWRLTMKYPVMMLNVSYIFFLVLPFYYIVTLPISLVLNGLDLNMSHKTGTGLLVTARKK